MSAARAVEVQTGDPLTRLIACSLCGVLLWDIDAHYSHAHNDGLEPVIREARAAAWDAGKEAALRQADWEYGASNRQYIATNPYDAKEEA